MTDSAKGEEWERGIKDRWEKQSTNRKGQGKDSCNSYTRHVSTYMVQWIDPLGSKRWKRQGAVASALDAVLFQDFSRLPHPNPSSARMDNIIGLKTNATSTQFNDNTCDISSILSNRGALVGVLCMCVPVNERTSIPQCCLPWNSERPSSRNCWTIFNERRGKPAGT